MKKHKAPQCKAAAGILRNVAITVRGLRKESTARQLLDRADHLEQGLLQISFIGDSGRGKTTLINTLLHDKWLLDSGVTLVDTSSEDPRESSLALANADAIVMLLNTRPLFTETDVEMIRAQVPAIETPKIEHMFFVINDFGDMTDEERKRVLEETAPRRLGALFGGDEALFARRVFLINIKAALDARRSAAGPDLLEKTGLPSFQRALQNMLTTDEGARIAMQAAMQKHLVPAFGEAKKYIQNQNSLLDTKVAAAETEIREQEERVDALISKKQRIQDDFEAFTQDIRNKAVVQSDNYIMERLKAWNVTWEKKSSEVNLSVGRTVSALFSKHKKEEIAHDGAKVCQEYLEETLESLPEMLAQNLQPEIEMFIAKFEKEMTELIFSLDEGKPRKLPEIPTNAGILNSKQILSAFKDEDWEITPGHIAIIGGIPLAIFLIIRLIHSVRAAFMALPIVLIAEAYFLLGFDREALSKTLRDQLGEVLGETFASYRSALPEDIHHALKTQFDAYFIDLLKVLDTEIDAVGGQMKEAATEREKTVIAVNREKVRLDTLQAEIDTAFNTISEIICGRVLTSEEQQKLITAATAQNETP